MVDLFEEYDSDGIESVYRDIMYECTPTNGQLKGKLPKLYELKKILDRTKSKKVDVVSYKSKYAMVCPRCGSAYPLDYYRCTEGFLVLHDSNGNGFAKRCRDTKNEDLGPLLVKEELMPFEKGLFF